MSLFVVVFISVYGICCIEGHMEIKIDFIH